MPLLHEQRGHVAILTLSRPQARNAWGEDYNDALKELLPQLEDDPNVRVVILTGDDRGGAFSAGANIKDPKTHTSASIADAASAASSPIAAT
jgi:enoyl-CoA hydratase/carnithine racemase